MLQVFRANKVLLIFPLLFCVLVVSSFLQHHVSSTFERGDRNVVLVTGGAGYIGTHTIVQLLSKNGSKRVICVDNFANSSPRALVRLKKVLGENVERFLFVKADLTNWREMHTLFLTYGHVIESCIHFGGLKVVTDSIDKPLEYYRTNLDSAIILLRLMQRHSVEKIIFSSSANVYGPNHASPISESARPLNPTNPYGRSKLMIENILTDVAAANPKLQVVLLRYFNPIGAHPSGLLGEQGSSTPTNIFPLLLRAASGRLPHVSVFGTDYRTRDGSCERDFIHVLDLADGHVAAIFNINSPGVYEINLGTGKASSVLQLIGCVEQASGRKLKIEVEPRRRADLQSVYANPQRAKEIMGWVATRSIDEACADGWKWEQANVEGLK